MADDPIKERLYSYIYLRKEVDHQLERLQRMRSQEILPAQKESDGSMHTACASDRMANAVIRRMAYEDRVMPEIKAAQAEMDAIEDEISALRDPLERTVLRLRYIDGEYCRHMRWRDVAISVYGDDDDKHLQAVNRIHKQALDNIRAGQEKGHP